MRGGRSRGAARRGSRRAACAPPNVWAARRASHPPRAATAPSRGRGRGWDVVGAGAGIGARVGTTCASRPALASSGDASGSLTLPGARPEGRALRRRVRCTVCNEVQAHGWAGGCGSRNQPRPSGEPHVRLPSGSSCHPEPARGSGESGARQLIQSPPCASSEMTRTATRSLRQVLWRSRSSTRHRCTCPPRHAEASSPCCSAARAWIGAECAVTLQTHRQLTCRRGRGPQHPRGAA